MKIYLLLGFLALLTRCGPTPQVTNEAYYTAAVSHARFTSPCQDCHESSRPDSGSEVKHGFGRTCGECHAPSDIMGLSEPWKPLAFSHEPAPTACLGCHHSSRPPLPHIQGGDCVSCHLYPSWQSAKLQR